MRGEQAPSRRRRRYRSLPMSLILRPDTKESSRQSSQLVRLSGMGTELAAAIIGMTLLGYLIDRWAGTLPWGVMGGAAVGILGGGYNFIRQARQVSRQAAEDFKRRYPHGIETKPILPKEEPDPWEEKWDQKWGDKPGDGPGPAEEIDDRR